MQIQRLIEKTADYRWTCTASNPVDQAVTYATSQKWFNRIIVSNKRVITLIPRTGVSVPKSKDITDRVSPVEVIDPLGLFVAFHNLIHEKSAPPKVRWSSSCYVSISATIGEEGMRYVRFNDVLLKMKHMGTVVLGERVDVGPNTVIHRGTIDDTVICEDTKIGSNVSIGHNCLIGARVMITSGVIIAGSVSTGDDCWFGVGTVVRDHLKICGGVKTGAGSVVVKDITEPGLYFGNPATKRGEWDGSL